MFIQKIKKACRFLPVLLCLFLIWSISSAPLYAAQEQTEEKSEPRPTKKKMRTRETWEYFINIPGQIVYFPFRLFYSGVKQVIVFTEKNRIVPKVKDLLSSDDGKRGAFPTYESRTGGGMKFFQNDLFQSGTNLQLTAAVGWRWRRLYRLRFQDFSLSDRVTGRLETHYKVLTDESFYGIGNQTLKQDESNYAHRQAMVQTSLAVELGTGAELCTTLGYDHNNIDSGRDPNLPSLTDLSPDIKNRIPGLVQHLDILRMQFHFKLNTENRPGNPSTGWDIAVTGGLFGQAGGESFRFWKSSVDIARYFHLFYDRTLMVRWSAGMTRPFGRAEVPFYYLNQLGPRETIRGFQRGRFHDRDLSIYSIEYRYPIMKRPRNMTNVDAFLFLDAGKVAYDLRKTSLFRKYHTGFGLGLRVFSGKGLLAQMIIGKSRDGFRFYFLLNN